MNRGGVREPRPYLLSIQLTALPYNPLFVPLLRAGHIPPPYSIPYLLDPEGENRRSPLTIYIFGECPPCEGEHLRLGRIFPYGRNYAQYAYFIPRYEKYHPS